MSSQIDVPYMYDGFQLSDKVEQLPFEGWKSLMRPLVERHGPTVDAGIREHVDRYEDQIPVYPPPDAVLRAFQFFDVDSTRAVIIGQDCYATPGDAMGLCFSVPRGTRCPPSLRNIFKELRREFGAERTEVDLTDLAKQGVLLLNTALTVRYSSPGSHLSMWEGFTTDVVRNLASSTRGVCFLLWGNHAISYQQHIPGDRDHLVLTHSHPSPLSRKPFEGCGHFGACNRFLSERGASGVDWIGGQDS